MSVDCTCKCANGAELNWEDAFKLPSECKGPLCTKGCAVDLKEALRRCSEMYNHDCNKGCIGLKSQLKQRCAEPGRQPIVAMVAMRLSPAPPTGSVLNEKAPPFGGASV